MRSLHPTRTRTSHFSHQFVMKLIYSFIFIELFITYFIQSVIVTTGVEPFGFDHSPFRRTDLKPTRFEVVSDQPPLVSHSENLWSRANFDLYYFNKSYIFNIPSHYSRLSFREPLGGIIWVSHNCNKLYANNFQIFCYIYFWQYIIINNDSIDHTTW